MVECFVGYLGEVGKFSVHEQLLFEYVGKQGEQDIFELKLQPIASGLNHYKIRMYFSHPFLAHKLELGYMIWV